MTEIRTVTRDDAESYQRCVGTAFLRPERDDAAWAAYWLDTIKPDLDRAWGAFEGGRAVGTLRSLPFELTVPGGRTVPADGVTMVTVAATHRRRGLLTRMIGADLAAAAERGDTASILLASEWPIYGRYGYAPATEGAEWEIDRRAALCPPPAGRLEAVSVRELRGPAPAVYDRARLRRAGGLSRPEHRWDHDLGLVHGPGDKPEWTGRAVLHRDAAGQPDGYLRWHSKWDDGPRIELAVDELVAASEDAWTDLWRYALAVDLVTHVRAGGRPVDEPVPWLLADGRAARQTRRGDELWLRLLDVPAALTARSYGHSGRVVLEVLDPAGYAAGRFALDASGDGATCVPTRAAADVTVPVTTLGSAYLGGHRLGALARAGLADEHRPGALTVADRLLATDGAPHTTLHF